MEAVGRWWRDAQSVETLHSSQVVAALPEPADLSSQQQPLDERGSNGGRKLSQPLADAFPLRRVAPAADQISEEQLTCTNRRAQTEEQKIARNEGFLVPPTVHLLCMCSLLVPSEFLICENCPRRNCIFCNFPGICCISESAKESQKLFGSALSQRR